MNLLAITTENENAINQVYNTAVGDRTTLLQLTELLKEYLGQHDEQIKNVEIVHGPKRKGHIPHSLARVETEKEQLGYQPSHSSGEVVKAADGREWEGRYVG